MALVFPWACSFGVCCVVLVPGCFLSSSAKQALAPEMQAWPTVLRQSSGSCAPHMDAIRSLGGQSGGSGRILFGSLFFVLLWRTCLRSFDPCRSQPGALCTLCTTNTGRIPLLCWYGRTSGSFSAQGRESTSFGLLMPLTRALEVVCWAVLMITRLRAQKRSLEWIDPVRHLCPDLNAWMWRVAVLSVCCWCRCFQKGWKRICTEIPRALRGALKHCRESSAGLLPGLREVALACVWFTLLFGGLVVRLLSSLCILLAAVCSSNMSREFWCHVLRCIFWEWHLFETRCQ